jgi:hypothetical protein
VPGDIGPLQNEAGETVTGTEDIANLLNKTFHGVFTREDINNISEPKARRIKP